jgi:3-dehydroquinate dehydratase / shikimate dehydrogenase
MTQLCVSLTEPSTTAVIDRMADLASAADLFEVRGDLVTDLDLLTILRARTKPIVFSCRAAGEGGRWTDTETRRRMTLLEAVKRGFDYVDVEYSSDFMDVVVEKSGNGLIVSHHDVKGMPADLEGLYAAMVRRGADIVKLAVTPAGLSDVARLLALAAKVAKGGKRPLLAIALGPFGLITRVLGGRYAAPFTYACAAPGAEAAPGQLPLASLASSYRVRQITERTRVYGLVGSDVTGSPSPAIHNAAFAARNLDAVYVPLQAASLQDFLGALPGLGLSGFAVTRPFKVEILPYLHEVEELAAVSGSVNTVVVSGGMLRGSSSDGTGVLLPLRKRLDVKGRRVVVIGTGGAARAASLALKRRGANVAVLGRNPAHAATLAAAVGVSHGPLAALPGVSWDALINATPVGSAGAPAETPVHASLLRPGSVVFDMVYDPPETRLMREARSVGCTVVGGLEMLVAQAGPQFEAWTGMEAPIEAMRQAAEAALAERRS